MTDEIGNGSSRKRMNTLLIGIVSGLTAMLLAGVSWITVRMFDVHIQDSLEQRQIIQWQRNHETAHAHGEIHRHIVSIPQER